MIVYYIKLEEVIELQYHNKQNIDFLFKWYWYDTIDRGIKVDSHHDLVEINTKARLRNIDNVFVFFPSNTNKFIAHALFPLKRIVLELIDYPLWKPNLGVMSKLFKIVTMKVVGDNVFQIDELIDPYQIAPSTNFEKNSDFHVAEITFVDVNAEKLNNILRTGGHTEVNEDDEINNLQFNEENDDGHDDDEKDDEEEEDNTN